MFSFPQCGAISPIKCSVSQRSHPRPENNTIKVPAICSRLNTERRGRHTGAFTRCDPGDAQASTPARYVDVITSIHKKRDRRNVCKGGATRPKDGGYEIRSKIAVQLHNKLAGTRIRVNSSCYRESSTQCLPHYIHLVHIAHLYSIYLVVITGSHIGAPLQAIRRAVLKLK